MSFLSVLPSVVVLGLAALAAFVRVRNRPSPADRDAERRAAARVLGIAAAIQALHFVEEASTGFHERLGALFGLPEMPFGLFVAFNVAWLAIWVASVPGVRSARPAAFFAAWFLAIAGMVNGIAHPLLAFARGGYFPGVWSAPIIGAVSVWLFVSLNAATRESDA